MKVLVLSNGKFESRDIDNTLESLQDIVGGYIEIPFISEKLYENGIDLIINEEGKLIEGLKTEIIIVRNETDDILDVIKGNCIFASHDEYGNTIGLNKEQEQIVLDTLKCKALSNGLLNGDYVRLLFI